MSKKTLKTNFLSLKNAGIINVHIQNRKKTVLSLFQMFPGSREREIEFL